jgi:hypothetical protein
VYRPSTSKIALSVLNNDMPALICTTFRDYSAHCLLKLANLHFTTYSLRFLLQCNIYFKVLSTHRTSPTFNWPCLWCRATLRNCNKICVTLERDTK